jgi:NADH:ubiquinone oxidoreductase subunit E
MNRQDPQPSTGPSPHPPAGTALDPESRRWRPPAHRIRLCRLESCEAEGRVELAQAIEDRLGIKFDERTADGAISLESLECIGLCGMSQAVTIDDEPVLGRDAVLRALDDLLR